MKNLGKILFFTLLNTLTLFAVEIKITPSIIYPGEPVTLTIITKDSVVEFPDIKKISGYKVEAQPETKNISNANKKFTKTLSKEYIFHPKKDFTLPPFKVIVDGKIENTKPMRIKVRKDSSGKGEPFSLSLEVDKTKAYIGEPINLYFVFKIHKDIDLAEAAINAPSFRHFWAKPIKELSSTTKGDYKIYRKRYLLFAQKSGKIKIEPGRMDVGVRKKIKQNAFTFERVKWKSIFSNDMTVDITPLPEGVNIYGNFKLKTQIDKQTTNSNEPVNLTITIKGTGNVDDIEEFKLDVKDAIVYADKPQRKIYNNDKEELGIFTQKFAIVSDRNFTIPSLKFTYFHSDEKKIKHLKSKQFDIEVQQSIIKTQTAKLLKKENPQEVVKTETNSDKISATKLTLFTLGGFIIGFLTALIFKSFKNESNNKKEKMKTPPPLSKRIKKSKSDKELLALLLPFMTKSNKMESLIKQLEENIYENKQHKIDKFDIIKHLDEYLTKEKNIDDILK